MLVYQRESLWLKDTLDKLAVWLELQPGMTAVDVGCGLGYMGYTYWPYFGKGGKYIGVDTSENLLDEAKQTAENWVKDGVADFRIGDAYKLPLPDNFADLVMCQTLLIHLKNPQKALAEMMRVAKSSGLVMCHEPNNLSALLEYPYWSLPELSIDEQLLHKKVALICNEGRIKLGQGDSSIGNKVPFMMSKLGLVEIGIRQNDGVCYIQPPYADARQKSLLDQIKKQWLDKTRYERLMERSKEHFIAGGGVPKEFDRYRKMQSKITDAFRRQVDDSKYFVCSSGHLYIIKGKKPV